MSDQRIALVTGGGRGIGRAAALRLAGCGYLVAVTARSESELSEVAVEIAHRGGQCLALPADLADPTTAARLVDEVEDRWGPLAILVNNAGLGSSADPRPLVHFDDEFWELTFAVNVTAPYRLTKRVLPAMLEAGWGRVINVASVNSRIAAVHGVAYTASKHALAGLTRSTALEVAGTGVTANAVCPGVTATQMNDRRLEYDAQRLNMSVEQLEREASPLGRRILPDEVAAMIEFLAGNESAAINGQCINVCGGKVMS